MTSILAWGQNVSFTRRPPGNSLPAIDHAYSLGYDGIELDVGMTKDGVPVLTHGEPLRDEKGEFRVHERSYADLAKTSVGMWLDKNVTIPTLSDALMKNGQRGRVLLDPRVSSSSVPAIAHAAKSAIFDTRLLAISAHSLELASAFKSFLPGAEVFLKSYSAVDEVAAPLADIMEAGCCGVMAYAPRSGEQIEDLMAPLKQRNLQAIFYVHGSWPPDRKEPDEEAFVALANMISAGTHSVLTVRHDFIHRLREERAERRHVHQQFAAEPVGQSGTPRRRPLEYLRRLIRRSA